MASQNAQHKLKFWKYCSKKCKRLIAFGKWLTLVIHARQWQVRKLVGFYDNGGRPWSKQPLAAGSSSPSGAHLSARVLPSSSSLYLVNCPYRLSLYLSLAPCVDHHSNRETGTAMYNWSPCLSHFNPFWAGDSTQKGYSWILPKQHSFFQPVSI